MIIKTDRVIAGTCLMFIGFLISLTLIGAILGIPLFLIGLFIMGGGIIFGINEKD